MSDAFNEIDKDCIFYKDSERPECDYNTCDLEGRLLYKIKDDTIQTKITDGIFNK